MKQVSLKKSQEEIPKSFSFGKIEATPFFENFKAEIIPPLRAEPLDSLMDWIYHVQCYIDPGEGWVSRYIDVSTEENVLTLFWKNIWKRTYLF